MLLVFSNPATNQQVLTLLLQTCNEKTGKKKKTHTNKRFQLSTAVFPRGRQSQSRINESVWNMYARTSLSSHASGA